MKNHFWLLFKKKKKSWKKTLGLISEKPWSQTLQRENRVLVHLLRLVAVSSRQQTTEKGHICQGSLDSLSNFQSSATLTHFKSHFDWISQRATWEYTHLHFKFPVDAEQQMNINSAISHYQPCVIMMNAILHWMSLWGRGKNKTHAILHISKHWKSGN